VRLRTEHADGAALERQELAAASAQPAGLPAGADLTSITAAHGSKLWIGGDVPTKFSGTVADFVVQFNGASWGAPIDLPRSGATAAA
jgi:hypothetical protein